MGLLQVTDKLSGGGVAWCTVDTWDTGVFQLVLGMARTSGVVTTQDVGDSERLPSMSLRPRKVSSVTLLQLTQLWQYIITLDKLIIH